MIDKWARGKWHLLAGTGLSELVVRVRSSCGKRVRDGNSEGFVNQVRGIIGCGGGNDDGLVTETRHPLAAGSVLIRYWDEGLLQQVES